MKRQKLSLLILVAGLLLPACVPSFLGSPGAPAVNTPAPTITPAPAVPPTSPPQTAQSPAVKAAQQDLAQKLNVGVDQVRVLSSEQVEWPDGCLGVRMPGKMCTQMVTSGYRVVFEVNGKQYEYHTNETGSIALQAIGFLAQTANKVLVWEQTANGVCSHAEIGLQTVTYGPCGGPLRETQLSGRHAEELAYLLRTYSPFSGDTQAGTVQFNGQGQQKPTGAEKRSVAEWANLVNMEAVGGRGGAAWGLALTWHREGGIAGFCDDLIIYLDGWAVPNSCKTNQPAASNEYRLTAGELEQLYSWADQLETVEYEKKDAATADAMLVKLYMVGQGTTKAADQQQEQIAAFAAQVYGEARK